MTLYIARDLLRIQKILTCIGYEFLTTRVSFFEGSWVYSVYTVYTQVNSVADIHKKPITFMLIHPPNSVSGSWDVWLKASKTSRKLISVLFTLIFQLDLESTDCGKEEQITLYWKLSFSLRNKGWLSYLKSLSFGL